MIGRARRATGAGILMLGLSAGSAMAGVPQLLTEQGRLLDATGAAVAGSIGITFTVYDAPTAGNVLWTETQTLTLDDGYFSAILGEGTAIPASVFNGDPRYLGVQVGTDPEMQPRQAVFSVPYAMVAGNVNGDITPTSNAMPSGAYFVGICSYLHATDGPTSCASVGFGYKNMGGVGVAMGYVQVSN